MNARFDDPDRLNDDGTVTLRFAPSTWRRYNISPDTYSLFTGESWAESEVERLSEDTGRDLTWDDLDALQRVNFEYDHAAIVRDLAQEACDWLVESLWDIGLESVANGRLIDTWSPKFYNSTSDGFEMELTCDPAELRALTPHFDVDAYGTEHYASCDGFISYVPRRLDDDDWHAEYDGAFRVESLLADWDHGRAWIYRLADVEWEVYSEHVTVTVNEPEERDSWGEDTPEMTEYARTLTRETCDGQLALGA